MTYQEYLESEHWQQARVAALEKAGYKCQLCSYRYGLEVHHNNYDNLWNESEQDLFVLCEKCHKRHHDSIPKSADDIWDEKEHVDFWPVLYFPDGSSFDTKKLKVG